MSLKAIKARMIFLTINLNLFLSLDQMLWMKNWTLIIVLSFHLDPAAAYLFGIALAAVLLRTCSNGSVAARLQTRNLDIAPVFAKTILDYKKWWNKGKKNLKKN